MVKVAQLFPKSRATFHSGLGNSFYMRRASHLREMLFSPKYKKLVARGRIDGDIVYFTTGAFMIKGLFSVR